MVTMDVFAEYANVIIPLAVSLVTGVATFFVYREKVSRLEKDVGKLHDEVRDIRDKVIACETSLREREPLTKRKSPISLSERGRRVLEDSGGRKFVDDNLKELKKAVEGKSPQTSYDVQEMARKVIRSMTDDTRLNGMKEYLFKEGIDIDDLITVLSIYLRDKVLEAKNWKAEDIDAHDPTNNH